MRAATERGLRRDELTVADVMLPAEAVEVIALADAASARVGHVVETLRRAGPAARPGGRRRTQGARHLFAFPGGAPARCAARHSRRSGTHLRRDRGRDQIAALNRANRSIGRAPAGPLICGCDQKRQSPHPRGVRQAAAAVPRQSDRAQEAAHGAPWAEPTLQFEDEPHHPLPGAGDAAHRAHFEEDGIQHELTPTTRSSPTAATGRPPCCSSTRTRRSDGAALAELKGVERKVWVEVEGAPRVWAIADEDLERENDEKPPRCTSCASSSMG